MGFTSSGFRTTIFWVLLAVVTSKQEYPHGSGIQSGQSNSGIPQYLMLPRLLCPNVCPPPCNCASSQNSGGEGSCSLRSYPRESRYGSASNTPDLPTAYQQSPSGSPRQSCRLSSQTYGLPNCPSSNMDSLSPASGDESYDQITYSYNSPPAVSSCPPSCSTPPQRPSRTQPTCPPTLPPPSTTPPTRPPSCCNSYGSSRNNNLSSTCPSGQGSSASSGNRPKTIIFCNPKTGAPTQLCSLSSNGSYVCCSTSEISGVPKLSSCKTNKQPPACPSRPSSCPIQHSNYIKKTKNYQTQSSCCPTPQSVILLQTTTCPTKPPSKPYKSSKPAPSSPKPSLGSPDPQTSVDPSNNAKSHPNIHSNAGLVSHSGDGKGGNRIYSCYNVLADPPCADPYSNQESYLIADSGNGEGGNHVCSNVNYVMGGTLVKNCGNGLGGSCIRSCVNIIGGNASLISNGGLWQSLCNVMIGTGCRNFSSPFGDSGCPSFSYDEYANDDPRSCSQESCSQDQDPGNNCDKSASSFPSMPSIIICPPGSSPCCM